jgi:hypothetical protein
MVVQAIRIAHPSLPSTGRNDRGRALMALREMLAH